MSDFDAESTFPTYPTWSRFINLWKTVILPVIKRNINIYSWDRLSEAEEYEITTEDTIDDIVLSNILDQIEDGLFAEGYVLSDENSGLYGCDLTIEGENSYSPKIGISVYIIEEDDLSADDYTNLGVDIIYAE